MTLPNELTDKGNSIVCLSEILYYMTKIFKWLKTKSQLPITPFEYEIIPNIFLRVINMYIYLMINWKHSTSHKTMQNHCRKWGK